jgi:hypothetical protein
MNRLLIVMTLATSACFAQTKMIIVGGVTDVATHEPLAYATIRVTGHVDETVSGADGKFELSVPATAENDTLIVTYVGYEKFMKPIPQLASFENVQLKEYATMLEEVHIVHRQADMRDADRNMKLLRGNLYASEMEVTNIQYNDFLSWLEDHNKTELRKKHGFKLDRYPKSVQEFYARYVTISDPKLDRRNSRRDSVQSFNSYPAVNITYEDAVAYCEWLTDEYNENSKKKRFKKVKFRLPTLKEWQIAALGDDKFQSWDLYDNLVEVIMAKDTNNFIKGKKVKMKYDDTILYPWYKIYHMRSRVYNHKGCYLGNFKTIVDHHCPWISYGYDGFTMMARVQCYFPNDIGLFDVVGNVAEMIDEKGKACGGSWNDPPEKSTIQSIKNYNGPDETVGFRVFMEVIEK